MINPFAVLLSAVRRTILIISALVFVTLYSPPEEEPQGEQEGEQESRSKLLQTVKKAFSQVLNAAAGCLAVALAYVLQCMQDAGVQLSITPDKVTPQVVIFGIQCALLALIGYWLLSFVYRLISPPVWRASELVKKMILLVTFRHKGVPLQPRKLKGPFQSKEKKQNAQKEGKEGKEGKESKESKEGKEGPEARRENKLFDQKSNFVKFLKKNKKQS